MNRRNHQRDLTFGLAWLVTCALGVAGSMLLAFSFLWEVGEALESIAGRVIATGTMGSLFGAFLALGFSLGPALLLHRRGLAIGRWLGASVAAGALGVGLTFFLVFALADVESIPDLVAGISVGLSVGLPVGVVQWWALRRQVGWGSEWVLVTSLAFPLALAVGFTMPEGGDLGLLAPPLILAGLTGLAMIFLAPTPGASLVEAAN